MGASAAVSARSPTPLCLGRITTVAPPPCWASMATHHSTRPASPVKLAWEAMTPCYSLGAQGCAAAGRVLLPHTAPSPHVQAADGAGYAVPEKLPAPMAPTSRASLSSRLSPAASLVRPLPGSMAEARAELASSTSSLQVPTSPPFAARALPVQVHPVQPAAGSSPLLAAMSPVGVRQCPEQLETLRQTYEI
eukprot:NODE_22344_length_712_cov_2.311111.p2 GENE.NODE_22344_length_712_cov_2.311111~~NODE_22344_length_712_cov_2.311111.p2  ORF type:complete len:192 (-),score=27.38 NODE_22344_length_712_cov_2.311111:135-710(-)